MPKQTRLLQARGTRKSAKRKKNWLVLVFKKRDAHTTTTVIIESVLPSLNKFRVRAKRELPTRWIADRGTGRLLERPTATSVTTRSCRRQKEKRKQSQYRTGRHTLIKRRGRHTARMQIRNRLDRHYQYITCSDIPCPVKRYSLNVRVITMWTPSPRTRTFHTK